MKRDGYTASSTIAFAAAAAAAARRVLRATEQLKYICACCVPFFLRGSEELIFPPAVSRQDGSKRNESK
jgi:hypothetical protein